MKKISLPLCIMLALTHYATAQKPVTGAEYFWDTDPGQGKGHSINIGTSADSVKFKVTIPLTGLSTGFHSLYARAYGDSLKWGIVAQQTVFIYQSFSQTAPAITAAEYFWDTDPGEGSGKTIAVNSSADSVHLTSVMPTTGLSQGFHALYVRTKNGSGNWSISGQIETYLYQNITPTPPNIVAAEYYWDTDPGEGKGKSITVGTAADSVHLTAVMPTTGLPTGFHSLYVRTKDAEGRWSLVDQQETYLYQNNTTTPPNIVAAEYFWDVDPGENKGTKITVSPQADSVQLVPSITVSMPQGFHNLYVRTKDALNHWSQVDQRTVYVTSYGATKQDTVNAAEYFIDTDPGEGKATKITVAKPADSINQAFVIKIPSNIDTGYHLVYVRARNSAGYWGMTESAQIHVGSGNLPISLLYFRATLNKGEVDLDWETTSEINSSEYDVERSADGLTFTQIADVAAAGNSSVPEYYKAVDPTPLNGPNFYRLKEVDKNGNVTYSAVVLIEINTTLQKPKLYPNPAQYMVHIDIPATLGAKNIIVYNNLGQPVIQQGVESLASLDVDVTRLAAGNYYVVFIGSNGTKTTLTFTRQ